MVQPSNKNYGFDSEGCNLKGASKVSVIKF